MSEEQLAALEVWIESIIEDLTLESGVHERLRRMRLREDVLTSFGLLKGKK